MAHMKIRQLKYSTELRKSVISMPTLIQINTCLAKGSTGRIAESIGVMMKKLGWDCYVVHGNRYAGETQLKSINAGSSVHEYLHALGSMLFDKHGLYSSSQTRKLIGKIRNLKPDVIQLHCVHGYYINYEILFDFLHELDVPVVWTFHDCWAFTGHCAHFDFAGCDKWKTGCHACELLKDYPRSFFVDNSKDNWQRKRNSFTSVEKLHIVAVSDWLAKLTRQSFLQKYPVMVIHNGIDLSVFKPVNNTIREQYGISEEDILVLGVATAWGKNKGLNDFIRLSNEPGIKVVLVGVSEEVKKSLPENVISVYRTENQHKLAEFYSAADMLVNPTYNDSFPTVNLEALACGTPVVTYRTGGSPEAIDTETGAVVEKGDYAGLLSNVRMFAQTSYKRHHSQACRKRAEEYFDMNRQFDEYRKLYESLLDLSNDQKVI